MKDALNKVLEFHRRFGASIKERPTADLPASLTAMRARLMQEELDEYRAAAASGDIVAVADALSDLTYVLLGTYITHGLQDAAETLFDEVHGSNMSKLGADGRPVLQADGKVLKSELFREPGLAAILRLEAPETKIVT